MNTNPQIEPSWMKNGDQQEQDKQYDRAISLIQYYVNLTWLIFGAFLLTETVLLAGIASIAKDGPVSWIFGGSILGLILAFPWWSSFKYNHALYVLRMTEASKCEPMAGQFFSTGRQLINGANLCDPRGRRVTIPAAARYLSPSHSVTLLIYCFAIVFLVLVITNFPWKVKVEDKQKQPATSPTVLSSRPNAD